MCVWTARHVEAVNTGDDIWSDHCQLCRRISSCGTLFTGPAVTLYNQNTNMSQKIHKNISVRSQLLYYIVIWLIGEHLYLRHHILYITHVKETCSDSVMLSVLNNPDIMCQWFRLGGQEPFKVLWNINLKAHDMINKTGNISATRRVQNYLHPLAKCW